MDVDEESAESDNPLKAIDWLVERFRVPLEGSAAEVSESWSEFEAIVVYATQFISLSTMEYRSVWRRLFHAPNSSKWSNILSLASHLFLFQYLMASLSKLFHR